MAFIDGKLPEPAPSSLPAQLVVKMARSSTERMPEAGTKLLAALPRSGRMKAMVGDQEGFSGAAQRVLGRYYVVDIEDGDVEQADRIARALSQLPEIEAAYVGGKPCPPPAVNAADDPRSSNQGYLNAAPGGIDARWAWAHTDGAGVGFVDLEQGWTLNHEDLAAANITLISGLNTAFPGHGTAVLGEVVAVDNTRGGIGIAPAASARVVSQYRTATSYNTAAAILSAAGAMSAGDVLLLEAQTTVGNSTYLPVEAEAATFDAIRHAVDQGIVVIEAGGNGSNNLDNFTDAGGKHVLDRNSADFKDSGAIMVGAASSAAPHTRLGFSNFGSRIDCFAWGQNIDTTGDGWQGNLTNSYTSGFGGTSGASPIVTGAALLMQSWYRKADGKPASPDLLRERLSDSTINTQSANPSSDLIGAMPDLRAILEWEQAHRGHRFRPEQYASFVQILIGLIDDSPGWIWVPGKGPVPVDPGWGRRTERLSPAQRSIIAALAIGEVSKGIVDPASRKALGVQAATAIKRSVESLTREWQR